MYVSLMDYPCVSLFNSKQDQHLEGATENREISVMILIDHFMLSVVSSKTAYAVNDMDF